MKTLQLIEKLSLRFDAVYRQAKRRHASARRARPTLARRFLFPFPTANESRPRHEL